MSNRETPLRTTVRRLWHHSSAAVALALGADLVGIARGLLEAATRSVEAVIEVQDLYVETLRVAMFAAGIADLDALRSSPLFHGEQLCR